MFDRGPDDPAEEVPVDNVDLWDDELDEWDSKPVGWNREWDIEIPTWDEVFGDSEPGNSRSQHPSAHIKQKPSSSRRRRTRDGWGSF